MSDLLNVMGHVALTGLVRRFEWPDLMLANRIPVRPMDGDVAEWVVDKPDIRIHNYFGGADMPAQPVRIGDKWKKTFTMFHRFVSKYIGGGLVQNLDSPGTDQFDSAMTLVEDEFNAMYERCGAYTDEFLAAMAIQDTLTINLGNDAFSTPQAVSYEIPASNKITVATPWTTPTANVKGDLRAAKRVLLRSGRKAKYMVMNGWTADLIHTNTTLQNYFKEYNIGKQIIETDALPMIAGLTPLIMEDQYADVDQTEGFMKPYIADGNVIIIPEFPTRVGDWIEFQEGRFVIPNEDQNGLVWKQGIAAWRRTKDSPTGLIGYLKVVRFPVIRMPWAIVILKVN